MKNKYHFIVLSVVLLIVLLAIGPRVNMNYTIRPVSVPQQVDQYISTLEKQFDDIRPGTEKKVVWVNPENPTVTPYSIVYLHGFSASRQEVAPLCDLLAKDLSANLYYNRFSGHGRTGEAMQDVSVDSLLNDANEALEIGKRLGKKVILIGSSTGGTLATWLSTQQTKGNIAALILLSPNFGLKRSESELLLYPWGKTILRLIEGEYYQFSPVNALQEQYWTTRYPSAALLSMMGLVDLTRKNTGSNVNVPALVLYAEEDRIVDTGKMKSKFREFSSPVKNLIAISNSADPQQHILAGDVLSPGSTETVRQVIRNFLATIVEQ